MLPWIRSGLEDMPNHTLFIYDIGHSARHDPKCLGNPPQFSKLSTSVGKQGEWQGKFFSKGCVARWRVTAHSQDHRIQSLELVITVPERTALHGTTRCVILGIEIDDHPLAPQRGQLDGVTVLIGEGEIGCRITDLESH